MNASQLTPEQMAGHFTDTIESRAKMSAFILECLSSFEAEDIDSDDADLRFEMDGSDTGCTVSITAECGKASEIIGSLLDALEARDKQIAELQQCAESAEQALLLERQKEVAVKLPKAISVLHRRDFIDAHRAIYAYPEAEVDAALAAAGISLQKGDE